MILVLFLTENDINNKYCWFPIAQKILIHNHEVERYHWSELNVNGFFKPPIRLYIIPFEILHVKAYCAYIDINTNILIGKSQLMYNTHKGFCNFTQKLSWKSCYVFSISVRDESKRVLPKHRLLFSSVKCKPSSKKENKL